ncbi:MAG: serine hydrolase [Candidatus Omnitrophica bacterium]|nr:serine hydrolase [Candidatus Omnitrophota bacterium]MDD5574771.1 serine hydrolase [Candidatus Omnitrophota bacterium]
MRRHLTHGLGAGLLLAVLWIGAVSAASQTGQKDTVTARAVYAVDYTNRKVLFARNQRMKLYPASTVKLMTALVVLDRQDLKDSVVVSSRAVNVEPTRAGLTRGASYSVADLLEVLLATSANDAGVALAESVAGSESEFAVLMNRKAKEIGMKDSYFANATGLPDSRQVTSAYDMSILTRTAFSHPFVKKVMTKKSITIRGSDGKKITRRNHNKLLWRLDDPQVLGKTGYTRSAGHCYAGIAYYDDRRVSVVILKSRKPWTDIYALLGVRQKKARR